MDMKMDEIRSAHIIQKALSVKFPALTLTLKADMNQYKIVPIIPIQWWQAVWS